MVLTTVDLATDLTAKGRALWPSSTPLCGHCTERVCVCVCARARACVCVFVCHLGMGLHAASASREDLPC